MTLSSLPAEEILRYLPENKKVLLVEEACRGSGVKDRLSWALRELDPDCRMEAMDLGQDYVPHGSVKKLYEFCGLDSQSIANRVKEWLEP